MYILTPSRAVFAGDIATRAELLKNVGDKHETGFEVVLLDGMSDLQKADKIVDNLKSYQDYHITLHGPLERNDYTLKHTDLTTEEGQKTLEKVLTLGKRINAEVVNVHTENFHLGKDLIKKDLSDEKIYAIGWLVFDNLNLAKENSKYDGKLTLENMPYPLMGDYAELDISTMPYDPLVNTARDIRTFGNKNLNIGICVDSCHYFITKDKVDSLVEANLTLKQLREQGILGLPVIKEQPNLTDFAKGLGDDLMHVHLVDSRGMWVAGKSAFEEGVVPGEGEHTEELAEFIKYLAPKDITVNLEVNDKDFKDPAESRRAIEWVLENA